MENHAGVILLIHDGTLLDFSGHTTLEDELGEIGSGNGLGWISHQTIAVDPTNRTIFGLISQILHVREKAVPGESIAAKRERKSRESLLWSRAIQEIGPTPAGATWIDVGDRGADIFEFLQRLTTRRFVVRSTHNRALGTGSTEVRAKAFLHDTLRALPEQTCFELEIPGKAGKKPRIAALSLAGQRVTIRPPHVKRGNYEPPLAANQL